MGMRGGQRRPLRPGGAEDVNHVRQLSGDAREEGHAGLRRRSERRSSGQKWLPDA